MNSPRIWANGEDHKRQVGGKAYQVETILCNTAGNVVVEFEWILKSNFSNSRVDMGSYLLRCTIDCVLVRDQDVWCQIAIIFRNERYVRWGTNGAYVVLPALAVLLQQSSSNRCNTDVVREVTRIVSKEIDKAAEDVFMSIHIEKVC
jgi:hypothetical protein